MYVFKAAVVGAGTMGGEIAQVIASAGIPVVLKDIDTKFVETGLEKARQVSRAQLVALVGKEKISQQDADRQFEEITGRISGATGYDGFGDVDFVIEAVPERMHIKQAVFEELDVATPGHAILASNTSSLSVAEMSGATRRPDRVVGFHFFYPASMMRLIEVIGAGGTSEETVGAATTFAQRIRKTGIRCADRPGFVVNRILNSAVSEIWRATHEQGLRVEEVDRVIQESGAAPLGPFYLCDLLGLDTVLHVAEHLRESYGDRFFVSPPMQELVAAGHLGQKTGRGFYDHAASGGAPSAAGSPGEGPPVPEGLVERFSLKALAEACLVLEEGGATAKDIEVGMMMGAGILPGPFTRADEQGLAGVRETLDRAGVERGAGFGPPLVLKRLVAQGRLGKQAGQGFFPYPRPDAEASRETVALETRDGVGVVWLARPPANPLSPQMIRELTELWGRVEGRLRAVVFASSNIFTFSAGADIKEFTRMSPDGEGRELIEAGHALMRSMERSSTVTIAAVNSIAYGGGCELAMACDFRLAAESASFGQPEINLGIIPGFGGTQRLARLVGEARALELNLVGDPISAREALRMGLVNRVVPDHELFDTAIAWAGKLAGQAPVAIEQIKQVSGAGNLDEGLAAEKGAFATVFASEDAKEGIGAFLGKRQPRFRGV